MALLGAEGILRILEDVVPRLSSVSHHFMSQKECGCLLQENLPEAMRVYWLELLYRARFAASAALLRHHRWLFAVLSAAASENFLGFAAALRALLESSADTHYSMSALPTTLAENIAPIRLAVKGQLDRPVLCTLEADLIHFLYGRKIVGEETPRPGHRTLDIAEYLRTLDKNKAVGVEECWRELCQLTHPSAFTVLFFLEKQADGGVRLGPMADREAIINFCRRFVVLLAFVAKLPVMQSLLTLHVLNRIDVPDLETPGLPSYGLEATDVWQYVKRRLDDG